MLDVDGGAGTVGAVAGTSGRVEAAPTTELVVAPLADLWSAPDVALMIAAPAAPPPTTTAIATASQNRKPPRPRTGPF